ncbi:serine/threonine-protein phosphatase 1 regulatory subunit 10 isoform X1 [Papilio machaon]|uniref:serine/threonine-protein phosphatase 1 regulatory subunit 10 isoform X1 n=1 Tax=Papilio machaon TaxID=76193 RepID=UPI001E6652B7|nr:serine/threonine-protein phosphatase 1 regulatory subunit 10 isoform X1 [Papilio machaon]
MPRICPMQLLNCLSVLLSPKGGIKSRDEVQRLASLMTKFSKKLVSKCIYIQILKCTETELLGLFMGSGGWRLVHMWLTESIVAKNWPLVRELLELLLLCPVDIERLKTNNCPKLVKELSKDGNHYAIRALASKLVEQWLKTVKGEHVIPILLSDITHIISDARTENAPEEKNAILTETEQIECEINGDNAFKTEGSSPELSSQEDKDISRVVDVSKDTEKESETLPVLKITLKNGKQIISQVDEDSVASDEVSDKDKIREKHRSKSKEKSSDRSSSSSRSSKHPSKSSSDKYKSSHKSSSSKHSSKERLKDKEKHSSHGSKSKHNSSSGSSSSSRKTSSSSKSKDDKTKHSSEKEKSKEKDDKGKESPNASTEKSDDKPSIHKLGKIPKLSDVKREKPSISIEVRKPDEPKPKTVKTFNSKFRKHGLEEEIKPPPSRAALLNKKPPPALPSTIPIPKRPSPVHNETPPEKKIKTIDIVEKPGAIKLIPPKPKREYILIYLISNILVTCSIFTGKEGPHWPMSSRKFVYLGCNSAMMLLESDMFMDALNASATNKKEPKKRKRRTSGSKDGNVPNDSSPPHTPTTVASPNSESKSVPPRFYQDTLDTEESSKASPEKNGDNNEDPNLDQEFEHNKEEKMDVSEPHTLTVNGLKGVLCYHKRKGPKKSIKWRPDSELEEIQYFELDETERVNVTKTFTDMKHLERIHEREAFQKGRNLSNDDVMEERTSWKPLIPIDLDGQIQVEYGKNSKEKDIQAIRQKGTLQPLYFHKSMIPDSPHEPDVETHTYSEPAVIPLEDVTGNQDNISDFRNMPWPEPKGNAPPSSNTNINVPAMFPPSMPQFPSNFPGTQFPGVPPGFQAPMVPTDWQNGVPPNMMPNGIPGPMTPAGLPPGPIPPGNIPPGMMMPPENMMMGPEMFGAPNPLFPVPPEGFNMQQNMFPMDFNMAGPQAAPGPDGFNGPGNFRGAMRGRGGGWRGKGGGNWEGPQRGRGGHARGNRKVVCMYFQRKGSCRQGDNCTFLHPGVNCPF